MQIFDYDSGNEPTQISSMKHKMAKNDNWQETTSWIFTRGAEELTTPVRDRQLARKVTGLGKKPYMKNNSRKKTFTHGEPKRHLHAKQETPPTPPPPPTLL